MLDDTVYILAWVAAAYFACFAHTMGHAWLGDAVLLVFQVCHLIFYSSLTVSVLLNRMFAWFRDADVDAEVRVVALHVRDLLFETPAVLLHLYPALIVGGWVYIRGGHSYLWDLHIGVLLSPLILWMTITLCYSDWE